MEIGSFFLILALTVVVILFITRPLFERRGQDRLVAKPEAQHREWMRSTLLADRDRLLNALHELDADNELGKLPEGEYAPQREKMVLEAADTLRRLDEMKLTDSRSPQPPVVQNEEDELEALVAVRRMQLVNQQKNAQQQISYTYCTHCGKPLTADDKFCSSCGTKVA